MQRKKLKTILTVDKAAVSNGILNPYQLHVRTGITTPRCTNLWNGTAKISMDDIDRLCDHLPCKVKDLFERVPAPTKKKE